MSNPIVLAIKEYKDLKNKKQAVSSQAVSSQAVYIMPKEESNYFNKLSELRNFIRKHIVLQRENAMREKRFNKRMRKKLV